VLIRLLSQERSRRANRQLGGVLAFVAGAINAGGYLAVQRYTSHITGIVSAIADDLAVGSVALASGGVAFLMSFIGGAVCTTVLINWARRRGMQSPYALALLLEAALLLLFGLVGANLRAFEQLLVPGAVLLLVFIMGLQNAIITKVTAAEIRTTHMTGIATDIGIELGRLLYWNRQGAAAGPEVRADRDKLGIHLSILGLFFGGGLVGALAFKSMGFSATIPIAAGLCVMALPAIANDLLRSRRS
jgi:uncharacterized membrane protein YoaK (UPF0700 family)